MQTKIIISWEEGQDSPQIEIEPREHNWDLTRVVAYDMINSYIKEKNLEVTSV